MFLAAETFVGRLNYTKDANWLSLLGPSGIGKTKLAREIYRHFMDHSRFVVDFDPLRQRITQNTGQFCCWRSFCSDLRGGSFGRIDDLEQDWLVILDDIGAENGTPFIMSVLDRICNFRAREGRPMWTVIACNLYLDQIAQQLDPRIADRMLRNGSVVIESELESWQTKGTKSEN